MTAYGLRWQSIVDFVVLAPSIYLLLRWSRDARALRVTIGILGLEVGALVAGQEERGDVTLMHDGAFRRVESADAMLVELKALFAPEPTVRSTRYFRRSELWLQSARGRVFGELAV